jgi:hypothetical protein
MCALTPLPTPMASSNPRPVLNLIIIPRFKFQCITYKMTSPTSGQQVPSGGNLIMRGYL